MSFFGGDKGPPAPPKFNPVNISKITDKALEQDLRRYFDYQFPVFPGMTSVRQREIEDAYKQLTSPLSKEFQNEFLRNATVTNRGATGGGDPYSGIAMGNGSFNKGAVSSAYTRQTMAKEDYDRARMEGLINQNPVPQLGLSQQDILSMYIYNTGAANASNMAGFSNAIAGANANFAAMQNDYNTIGSLISGLGNIYANYQYQNG